MSGPSRSLDRNRLQSWVEGVRSGSLDQQVDPAITPSPHQSTSTKSLRPSADDDALHHQARGTIESRDLPVHVVAHPGSHSTAGRSSQAPGGAAASTSPSQLNHPPDSLDSLHQLQNAGAAAELLVPLPESRSTSPATIASVLLAGPDAHHQSRQSIDGGSLSQLQNADISAELRIPLPQSTAASPVDDTQQADYWTGIDPLLECLPHLRSIEQSQGRYTLKGSVSCIDYVRDHVSPRVHPRLRPGDGFKDSLRKLKNMVGPEVLTRYIVIEDLSSEIIEGVGSVFEVDPELFAEHLHRSGYGRMDYDDPWPIHWMSPSHISLKWFRPVKQSPQITQWMSVPSAMLNMTETEPTKTQASKVVPGSKIWLDPTYNTDGTQNETASRHQVQIATNIFRRSRPMSTRHGMDEVGGGNGVARGGEHKQIGSAAYTSNLDWEDDAVPAAWEERASFFRCMRGAIPIIILILDPLPSLTDFQTPLAAKKKSRKRASASNVEAVPTDFKILLPLSSRLPYKFPRNKFEAGSRDLKALKHATRRSIPTSEAIRRQSGMAPECKSFEADPILGLLRVVQLDCEAFFESLEWALAEIRQDSLDDYLMSRRLERWRKLMSDFEIEVPALGKSLHDFVAFVFQDDVLPSDVQRIVDKVDQGILRINARLVEAYAALRADMQFSEGRRSINEAKTVTKLTELAFIFIPLSFTASLFSMSIHELESGVPAWIFIVTSLAMALLAYGVRLALTSEFLAKSTRSALERFWNVGGLQRGTTAPFWTITKLTLQEIWRNGGSRLLGRACVMLFLGSVLVIPIAFAWTSTSLDVGFHLALTLFLLVSTLGLAIGVYCGTGIGRGHLTPWANASDIDLVTSGDTV